MLNDTSRTFCLPWNGGTSYLHGDIAPRGTIPPSLSSVPPNVFIVGTVNVDGTTYMFSPKVLDRANVLEFRIDKSELASFLSDPKPVDLSSLMGKGKNFARPFIKLASDQPEMNRDVRAKLESELVLFFDVLASFGSEFGFRTVIEAARFTTFFELIVPRHSWDFARALDAQVIQKLLPKLHGSRGKLEPILCALGALSFEARDWQHIGDNPPILNNEAEIKTAAMAASKLDESRHPLATNEDGSARFSQSHAYLPLSFDKICRMLKHLQQNGFASFAEA